MAFPYLTSNTFCITLSYVIDNADLIEALLNEYPHDTQACIPIALSNTLQILPLPVGQLRWYLQFLWYTGVTINQKLDYTASNGFTSLVNYFLDAGADVNADYGAALRNAARGGYLSTVELLLDRGAGTSRVWDDRALIDAARGDHVSTMRLLLNHNIGCDVMNDALLSASRHGSTNAVKFLLDNSANIHTNDDESLVLAATNGHTGTVELLIHYGSDDPDNKALYAAVKYDHADTVLPLLGNQEPELLEDVARAAADDGALSVMSLLMKLDSNIDYDDLLVIAAGNDRTEMVKFLLDEGADVNARNDSALLCAVALSGENVVKLLLDRKANVNTDNNSALKIATSNEDTGMIRLLIDYGANPGIGALSKRIATLFERHAAVRL